MQSITNARKYKATAMDEAIVHILGVWMKAGEDWVTQDGDKYTPVKVSQEGRKNLTSKYEKLLQAGKIGKRSGIFKVSSSLMILYTRADTGEKGCFPPEPI